MENKNKLKFLSILTIAIVGFVTTIKLAMIYYDANFNKYAMDSFCHINEFIDCDGIAKTRDAQFLGIPLAYWGMFLYLFIIFQLFVDKLKNIKIFSILNVFKNPMTYIAALGYISFAVSMSLAAISIFSIKKLCILCVFTYFLNLLIALIATDKSEGFFRGFVNTFKTSIVDFIQGVKDYTIPFIVAILLASSFLAYTKISYVFVPHIKRMDAIKPFIDAKTHKYAVKGNLLGKKDGKVLIVFSDYICPICRVYDRMLYKLARYENIRVVHMNYPLDKECNKYISYNMHPKACMMSRYAIASEMQGKFWEMNAALFDKEPKTEADVLKIAEELDLDIDKLKADAQSERVKRKLARDINFAHFKKVRGTPGIIFDKKLHMGLRPYYELKDIVNGKYKPKEPATKK